MKNQTVVTAKPDTQNVTITREFDAPRELVFKAYADPALLALWLGPRGMEMTVQRYDFRSGGSYRFTHIRGNEQYVFNGVFHEISVERMIQTFEYEGLPEKGHVSLDSLKLEALPGNRTRLTIHSVFQSVEDRDGMVKSGMERGVREGHERLDELLAQTIDQVHSNIHLTTKK